ncbi:MAG: hypothetical protein WC792_04025 [Candidatus Micrarchaeia archaeon]|jgi:hypothetical protein
MGLESFVSNTVSWFMGSAQFALRRFVVYSLVVFTVGMLAGVHLMQKSLTEDVSWAVVFAPLVLAFLAYLSTEIAAVIFIIAFLGIGLLLLL